MSKINSFNDIYVYHNFAVSKLLFNYFNITLNMTQIEYSVYDLERNVKIPTECEDLSEFFGILMGDGYLINRGRIHKFCITLNLKEDIKYATYVMNLIKKLFNLFPTTLSRPSQNTFEISINSKAIASFLFSQNFPSGFKKNMIIPKWILTKKQFMKKFIRGLVDTMVRFSLQKEELINRINILLLR